MFLGKVDNFANANYNKSNTKSMKPLWTVDTN